jgi:glyoxalase family protein
MSLQVHGIHHLTAVTAKASENLTFYTGVLGLRLVKKTVNQDDLRAYHLFYADAAGSPGTDLTFFDWPAARERRGNNSVTRTGLRVPRGSAAWWAEHFAETGVSARVPTERDGRTVLDFEDPEGQRLSLVEDAGVTGKPVDNAIPAEHQIIGLGPVTLTVPGLFPTDQVLERAYGMERARSYLGPEGETHVFTMAAEGPHGELHVVVRPSLPPYRPGAGGVHHVAFRIRDEDYHAWDEHLTGLGLRTSGVVERYYFRSIYYREPNGVL